jgi:MoaA/NifB/PqqE/SkfB family radical SAM enzyme
MVPMKLLELHIEPTNLCTLKCSSCARTQFINQWPQHWVNHSLDCDQLLKFLDIDLSGIKIRFEGNYGDPIYHPEFFKMINMLKQRGCHISITTNGSYRTKKWWNELCSHLDDKDVITFSIDGVPENFTQYRINADWETIEIGIQECVKNKIKTIWKFIPFAFNEAHIEKARALSKQLGMTDFLLDPSNRFDDNNNNFIPIDTKLIGPLNSAQKKIKEGQANTVDPECYQGRSYYISSTGHFTPCCYAADHRFYYKNEFGKNQKTYDIKNNTLTGILNSPQVVNFYNDIVSNPPQVCQFNCPKLD